MKQVELVCAGCDKLFSKPKKEYDRQVRNNKSNFYCTRQCSGVNVSPKNFQTEKAIAWRNSDLNRQILTRRNKERKINPFRCYLHHIKKRRLQKVIDVDENYLRDIWDQQSGCCAYTGLLMEHTRFDVATDTFTTASIDRIDSSLGYIKGNVQFVIRALNLAKGAESDDRFREFLWRLKIALDKQSAAV